MEKRRQHGADGVLPPHDQAAHPSEWATITSITTKFGMMPETLRKWVRRAEVDASGSGPVRWATASPSGERPAAAARGTSVPLFAEGQLEREEIIEGVRRFSVGFVFTRNLTVQDDAMRTFATFTAGAFEQQLGTPELTTGRSGQRVFEAWAKFQEKASSHVDGRSSLRTEMSDRS